ncbi:MAG: LytTR family transcriptional regulator DNA-binding domain-containing protein [Saprospiraceae bacterium]|nr:LytTR family transcriptional regulator DNA-binding domain-containing protein [Saprospiraceae bacterium]
MLFLTQGYAISSIFKSIDGKYFHNNVLSPYIFAVIFDQKTLSAAIEPPSRSEFYRQALLIGMGVFAVLAVFQPFGTYVFEHDLKYLLLAGYGLLIPLTGVALREIIALIKPEFFDRSKWTFRRELVLTGLFLLGGVVMSYFYHHLAIGGRLSVRGFFWFVFFALTTVSLPMALLLAWRFFYVKNQLAISELSQQLTPAETLITLLGENRNEKLTLHRDEVLYLRAADNYVEIFLLKNQQVQRLMFRGALSSMFQQLEKVGTFKQVHRSFVVNMDHTVRLEGKSPAYFLVFENAPATEEIPVSRLVVADIRETLASKPR